MSGWELLGGLLFSGIGFVACAYGRKMGRIKPVLIGVLLMCYPYFVAGVFWLYGIGAVLTGALCYFRD